MTTRVRFVIKTNVLLSIISSSINSWVIVVFQAVQTNLDEAIIRAIEVVASRYTGSELSLRLVVLINALQRRLHGVGEVLSEFIEFPYRIIFIGLVLY